MRRESVEDPGPTGCGGSGRLDLPAHRDPPGRHDLPGQHDPTGRSDVRGRRDAAPARTGPRSGGGPGLVAMQRTAGNRAVAGLVRDLSGGGAAPVVQRDGDKDPADLTGTPFAALDGRLQTALKDKTVFPWSRPTLAESLGTLSNGSLATLARIGALLSARAPFLWDHVARLGGGDWITDNFGMRVGWRDGAAVGALLAAHPDFCRDNPATATIYHGTTSAYRQIAATAGTPSLHVITAGTTEVHIDVHQPVEGKEQSWPWQGQCNYDLSAWWDHAADVMGGGGGGGAIGTAIGRYARARDGINVARRAGWYRREPDEPRLLQAEEHLQAIATTVQRYAAMGGLVGDVWEGDRQMLADAPTMARLQQAEELVRLVDLAQFDRRPPDLPAAGM